MTITADITALQTAMAATDAMTYATDDWKTAVLAAETTQTDITAAVATQEAVLKPIVDAATADLLGTSDPTTAENNLANAVTASGNLAAVITAQGYVNRIATNLANAGT